MAIKGLDLLVARRRQHVTAQAVAAQMGVTRQYVSKLEAKEDVTPEAAEDYRAALAALEGDRQKVTIEVDDLPNDYRLAGRKVRAQMRAHPAAKTLYTVVTQPGTPWQAVLAVLDSIAAVGASARLVLAGGEGDPSVLKRVG